MRPRTMREAVRVSVASVATAAVIAGAAHAGDAGGTPPVVVTLGAVAEGDASDAGTAYGALLAVRVPVNHWLSLVPTGLLAAGGTTDRGTGLGDTLSIADGSLLAQINIAPRHAVSPFLQAGFGRRSVHRRYARAWSGTSTIFYDTRRHASYLIAGAGCDVRAGRRFSVTALCAGAVGDESVSGSYVVPRMPPGSAGNSSDVVVFGRVAVAASWRVGR